MSHRCLFIILYFMLSHRCDSLVPSTSVTKGNDISRRSFIAGNIFVGGSLLAGQSPTIAATNTRDSLLKAVDTGASDDVVLALIEDISRNDPSNGGGATSPALSGKWELLWSAKAEAFSPLLALPRPLRPESLQLLGDAAVQSGGGGGRVGGAGRGNRSGIGLESNNPAHGGWGTRPLGTCLEFEGAHEKKRQTCNVVT